MAFGPDGRRAVSGSEDGTALVWDLTGRTDAAPEKERLTSRDLEMLWDDLGADAGQAHRAIWRLVFAPEETLPYLKDKLQPIPAPDAAGVGRLLANLDADNFVVREKATQELALLGDAVAGELRQCLKQTTSPEVRQRLESLLKRLTGPNMATDLIRGLRSVEVLEQTGTPAARQVLENLAKGAAGARLTREARASLVRMR
jgi:hypothetical protein